MDDQTTAAVECPTTLELICALQTEFTELVDLILTEGRAVLDPVGEVRHVGLMSWMGKWVRSRNVFSSAGQKHLAAALAEEIVGLSITMSGSRDPFYSPPGSASISVSLSLRDERMAVVGGRVPLRWSDRLPGLVELLGNRFEIVAGGAWNGPAGVVPVAWAPPWWRVKPLVDPVVAGPLWLLVVPAEGHRRLLASARACELAVGYQVLAQGGALWQLCDNPSGPQGAELTEWESIFAELGMTDTSWEKAHPKTGVVWTPPPR